MRRRLIGQMMHIATSLKHRPWGEVEALVEEMFHILADKDPQWLGNDAV
jgi:hypothetical protein